LIDSRHPVALAVEPFRAEAIERTKQFAAETVEKVRNELEAAGNDLNKCAPFPSSKMYGYQYHTANAKYRLFHSVCKSREACSRPNQPNLADVSPERVERFIQDAAERAAIDYDAFIVKLCGKIGRCDSAEINGSHVWGYSLLTVAKGETIEVWKTQQIVNTSKLGKVFNQWPSRKVKR
jgi:hypothetical protein